MKTVALLFSFAFVLVFTAPTDESIQLHTISYEANKILNGGLEPEDFCIAETILSAISHTQFGIPLNTLSKIRRVLNQYNKFHPTNCTVKENDDEEQLHDLLTNLCICSQVVNSRPHPAAHHN